MKKLFYSLVIVLILYASYYDLSTGTLPEASATPSEQANPSQSPTTIPAQEVVVDSGYTVLSIVEHLHEGPIRASIQEIIYDFKQLNDGIEPEDIQVGQTYLFPLYQE
ncbi:hypothetical protein [Alkalihalobacillus sp. LMS39]|uniref:hypothetical protein n=1 Tax=Alkalihalobacillus sp. LMS39 TaxID=2924032 RepID=UPI001FB54BD4|nr:hypothetical protein [Alkalihalobacillus sp. LMS39]UOE95708.1 hypothetical protein MM271_08915 [Alkalihalobacillus sp. LMS39]